MSPHHIKCNWSKCNLIIYTRENYIVNLEVKVFDEKVEVVNKMKYLGCMMSTKIEKNSFLEHVTKDFNPKFNIFMENFHKISSLYKDRTIFSVLHKFFMGPKSVSCIKLNELMYNGERQLEQSTAYLIEHTVSCYLIFVYVASKSLIFNNIYKIFFE